MTISQEVLMRKIKEEVAHAEKHMHSDQFSVYIGKLHVLCELLLDQPNDETSTEYVRATNQQVHTQEKNASHIQEDNPELLEGDSIFDF